ncbi:MAG: hypothetical protein A2991_02905 [Candidatus Terrybacteria bacterium RIFCSPLOWO2_01_FULL_58_14]|uniref:Uncharacterized protein n=2 Tax=Candidatus Terryibacteriota TaxID=1817920 RepID=A0A1G2Q0U5_9BACT|nr:MAG: hypothetical protein A2682_02490 [Candidatus Terrybacteria bacterium RIFCSPHIGHO2_01_FULL_58_15]OHA54183.1 MAG: hypothetical protein A2991_02905 [Candidatus Terrybacteria bacterium RIFCSPLOWO2_01_FULL_58_14]
MAFSPSRSPKNHKEGIALITTVLLLAIALGLALGIASIAARQIRIAADIAESAAAVVAADAGAEAALWNFWRGGAGTPPSCSGPPVCPYGTLGNGATYSVSYNFTASPRWIRSVGEFRDVRRAFELTNF